MVGVASNAVRAPLTAAETTLVTLPPASDAAEADSAATRITVRIVPSTGSPTDSYASRAAAVRADAARCATSTPVPA